jgi:hypothetical protein
MIDIFHRRILLPFSIANRACKIAVVCRRELSQARVDQEGIIPTAAVK